MKLKVLFILALISFIVFVIYLNSKDTKVYYLTLGDYLVEENSNGYAEMVKEELEKRKKLELYLSEFNIEDARVTDMINQIEENRSIKIGEKERTIKNALIKADLVLLSVGSNDLFYKLDHDPAVTEELYDRVDQILEDSEKLYKLLREYSKEDIFVTGFYNPYSSDYDELIDYANERLKKILNTCDMSYIEVNKCINTIPERLEEKLTKSENQCVYQNIEREMEKKLFES